MRSGFLIVVPILFSASDMPRVVPDVPDYRYPAIGGTLLA